MKKENRKVLMTKQMLGKSLMELLSNHHLSQISVSLLCEHANINRTTFYKHYKHVIDLLDEIEQQNLNFFLGILNDLNISKQPQGFTNVLQSLFDHIKDDSLFFKTVITNENYSAFLDKLIKAIYEKVDERFPISLKKTPETFVYIIHGSIALVKLWIQRDFHLSSKEMTNLIFAFSNKLTNA